MIMKTCNRCKIEKDESEYYLDRGVHRGICKVCMKLTRKFHYELHRADTLAAVYKYNHSPKGSKKRKEWLAKRSKTPKQIAYQKKWAVSEKGKVARRGRVNRFAKTEKGFAANKKRHAKRRSNLKNIIADLTTAEWKVVLKEFDNKCAYCGVNFTKKIPPTQDHVIPVSKGGNHTKTNVVPACRPCNSKKKDKLI